jgi:hypothetical protein
VRMPPLVCNDFSFLIPHWGNSCRPKESWLGFKPLTSWSRGRCSTTWAFQPDMSWCVIQRIFVIGNNLCLLEKPRSDGNCNQKQTNKNRVCWFHRYNWISCCVFVFSLSSTMWSLLNHRRPYWR